MHFPSFIMLISSARQEDKLPLCSEEFCLNPVSNVYSTTPVEVLLELLLLTRNPSLLVLTIYGKANLTSPLNAQCLPFLSILEVQNPSFPPFHVFFEKSFNHDTKFVYFLTKTFSCCYLCCLVKECHFHFQLS